VWEPHIKALYAFDPKAARAAWEKLSRRNPNYAGLAALKDRLGPGVERGTR